MENFRENSEMNIIDKIQEKLDNGYIGTDESVLYEQMMDDLSSVLTLFYAKNREIESRIEQLENKSYDTTTKHGVYNFNVNSAVISELKNLLK